MLLEELVLQTTVTVTYFKKFSRTPLEYHDGQGIDSLLRVLQWLAVTDNTDSDPEKNKKTVAIKQ